MVVDDDTEVVIVELAEEEDEQINDNDCNEFGECGEECGDVEDNSLDSWEKEAPTPQDDDDLLKVSSFEDITNVYHRRSLLFHDFDRKKI